MILKTKLLNIESGGPLVAVLNPKIMKELDLAPADRIRIMAEKRYAVAIANSSDAVKENQLGIYDEIKTFLNLDADQPVTIIAEEKPASIADIKRKLDGAKLSKEEIFELITDIVDNRLTRAEVSAFIAAVYTQGMDIEETAHMTQAMAETGQILKLNVKPIMDLHSVGGVPGNRITMIVIPIVAAAGLYIPKTASRAITDPSGTADTMEVLAPVAFDLETIKEIVTEHNGCIVWGGSLDLAPADDIIIEVEHPLRIDPTAMLLASILAKKYATGITHLLLEIPYGPGTKCTRARANELEKKFVNIGARFGMAVDVVKIDGTQPVGFGIGPALECRDVLKVLERAEDAPADLKNRSLFFAARLLEAGGKAKRGKGLKMAKDILESGKALSKFKEIIRAQGGDPNIKSKDIQVGKYDEAIFADQHGVVQSINNDALKKIGRHLGAPYNKGAGIFLHAKIGDKVKEGDKLFTIYAESGRKLAEGLAFSESNIVYKLSQRKSESSK